MAEFNKRHWCQTYCKWKVTGKRGIIRKAEEGEEGKTLKRKGEGGKTIKYWESYIPREMPLQQKH